MPHFAHSSDHPEQLVTAPLVCEIRSHLTWLCSLRVTKSAFPKEWLAGFGEFRLNIDVIAICQRHGALYKAEAASPTEERRVSTGTVAADVPVGASLL